MGNIISYLPVRENGELVDIFLNYRKETSWGYVIESGYLSEFLPCRLSIAELKSIINICES